MKLFPEERELVTKLVQEWYDTISGVTDLMNRIFSEKGQMYDRESPVWERIKWPHGFIQEIAKKTDRVEQLLSSFSVVGDVEEVNWKDVEEELIDIANYARMFAAVTRMLAARWAGEGEGK